METNEKTDHNDLIDSVKSESFEKVSSFFDTHGTAGESLINKKQYGYTALHFAIQSGKVDIIKLLVSKGADINEKDGENRKPLISAVITGDVDVVEFFLHHEQCQVDDRETALNVAAKVGDVKIVQFLLKDGVDAKLRKAFDLKAIHIASQFGHTDVIELFLVEGQDINDTDVNGNTPLHHSTAHGTLETIKFLIGKGANMKAKNVHGQFPFHYAAIFGRKDILQFFVKEQKMPVFVRAVEDDNQAAIHYAAKSGHLNVIKFLLKNRARYDTRCKDRNMALHISLAHGHKNIFEFLRDMSNIDERGHFCRTPLHFAAEFSDLDLVKNLVARGAYIYARDNASCIPMHYATANKDISVLKYFLNDLNISIHVRDKERFEPLTWAAYHGNMAAVKFLLDKNADIYVTDTYGNTGFHWAAHNGHLEVMTLFLNLGIGIDDQNEEGYTSLHMAAYAGQIAAVKLLCDREASTDIRGKDGLKPIDLASLQKQEKVKKLLSKFDD